MAPHRPALLPHDILDLPLNDEQTTTLTALTLVGRLLTTKRINFKVITAVLHGAWNLGSNVTIKSLDATTISCTFNKIHDRDKVLNMGPWAIKGALLNILPWPPSLPLSELDFSKCYFWVQIHNLPSNRQNAANATKIGSTIGSVCRLDESTPFTQAKKFIRVQILVDTSKPLKTGCFMNREDDTPLWLALKYKRLSDFCYLCGCIDHTDSAYTLKSGADDGCDDPRTQYGPWLRGHFSGTDPNSENHHRDRHKTTLSDVPVASVSRTPAPLQHPSSGATTLQCFH